MGGPKRVLGLMVVIWVDYWLISYENMIAWWGSQVAKVAFWSPKLDNDSQSSTSLSIFPPTPPIFLPLTLTPHLCFYTLLLVDLSWCGGISCMYVGPSTHEVWWLPKSWLVFQHVQSRIRDGTHSLTIEMIFLDTIVLDAKFYVWQVDSLKALPSILGDSGVCLDMPTKNA